MMPSRKLTPRRAAALALLVASASAAPLLAGPPASSGARVPPPNGQNADLLSIPPAAVEPLADPSFESRPAGPRTTSLSCTVEAALDSRPCLLDGEQATPAAELRRRDEEAAALADDLCERLAPAASRAACSLVVVPRVSVCAEARRTPISDAEGRFLPTAARCFEAVRHAAEAARLLLGAHRGCCACLTPANDQPGRDRCLQDIAAGSSPAGVDDDRCRGACAALLLATPAPSTTARAPGEGSAAQEPDQR